MSSFDWSTTPVGPIEGWPQSLKTAVRIMLTSRYAMWMAWGPELTFFCNDAYRPTLGVKHGWALGSRADRVWEEIWPEIGPRIATVLKTGTATWDERLLLFLERSGYAEETYHTFSYSPLADDRGLITGMLCVVTEDTERVIGERRLRTLRELGLRTSAEARTAEEACAVTAKCFAATPQDVPFALIYLLDETATRARLAGITGLECGTRASPLEIDLARADSPQGWPLVRVASTKRAELVTDVPARLGPIPSGPWSESSHSALVLPLVQAMQDRLAGFLVAGISSRRRFDDDYRGFLELAAAHVGTTIANARAYEMERCRAEALAELDRAKTTFFSNVSHEFRTPLTLILGPVVDALSEPMEPPQRERMEALHWNALRLQKLVNTLLDFSRIEAGRIQAHYEPTDLAGFTAELASVFRSAVERAGMRLIIDCPTLAQPVFVDRDMWEKVVLNLVSNAFKFTLEGRIEVSLEEVDSQAVLRVRDTGTGISEEQLPHVFERFHRVEGARARTHEGSGIGLALVQELVRLHGGSVGVESVVGAGTTFTVRLPLGKAHLPRECIRGTHTAAAASHAIDHYIEEALRWLPNEPGDKESAEATVIRDASHSWVRNRPTREAARQPRIVLADDNTDLRKYLMRLLASRYQVEAVADGAAALAAAKANRPALVLTDVMMPTLDGFGLLKELRSDPETRTVPVIMLSARAGEEARVEGLEAGADDYVIKPFSARELLARVSAVIELARLRREATAANERASSILESITDGFITLDRQWRFTYVNSEAERINGMCRSQVLGRDHWEVFPRTVGTTVDREYRRAVAEQVAVQFENYYEPWGRWFEIRAYPAKDGGLSVYFRDITEPKRATSERERLFREAQAARADAEAANRMKDEFLATLSHELRTPLNAILGWATILRSGRIDGDDIREGYEVIERNARTQAQLIDDLLDVSRIISGKMTLDVQPVNVPEVTAAAIAAVSPAAEAKGVRIQQVLDSFAGPVAGDATRIQQVVWNLLSNAIKFTPKGGQVQVLLERVNSHVEVSVIDTGVGIKPEFLPYVFERFRQADATTTRRHGGLGLGLAIVKQLVEIHGGTVRAKSPGEGQGATFTVTFPITIVPSERVHSREPEPKEIRCEDGLLSGIRVLVVDDEVDTRQLIQRILTECHAEVLLASSTGEALERLGRALPDVLLSDIGMPETDGYDLIREIRDRFTAKQLPAAALTAFARSEDRRRTMLAGFQTHVSKPVDPDELIAVVASLAGRTGRR